MPDIILDTIFNNPLLRTEDTVVFRDNFQRADGLLTGSTTPIGGLTWMSRSDGSSASTSGVIRGGAAGILSDTSGALRFDVIDTGSADGIYEARFVSGDGNTQNFLPFRIATVNNFLQVTVTNNVWTLRKRVSGTYSTIAVSQVQKQPGQLIRIELKGPRIRVLVNGLVAIDTVESEHSTNTMFGIGGLALATTTPASLWDDVSFVIPGS